MLVKQIIVVHVSLHMRQVNWISTCIIWRSSLSTGLFFLFFLISTIVQLIPKSTIVTCFNVTSHYTSSMSCMQDMDCMDCGSIQLWGIRSVIEGGMYNSLWASQGRRIQEMRAIKRHTHLPAVGRTFTAWISGFLGLYWVSILLNHVMLTVFGGEMYNMLKTLSKLYSLCHF